MRQETILKKARKVLANNKGVQDWIKWHNETAKKLTHWGIASIDEMLFTWDDGTVVLSNESSIPITNDGYLELLYGLNKEFKKAGLFVEAYDAGTFCISEE